MDDAPPTGVPTAEAAQETAAPPPAPRPRDDADRLRRRVRRLRIGLAAALLLALVSVVAVGVSVWYWKTYLLKPSGPVFRRGPFLTRLDTSGATFAWTLRKAGAAVTVRAVGPDGRTVTAADGVFRGLAPGTEYAWTADVRGDVRASGTFRTAPLALASGIRFAVIGDYGSGNDHEYAVARVVAAQRPDFLLTAGDNSYILGLAALLDRNIFDPLQPVIGNAPIWATLGEHDLFANGGAPVTDALHLPGPRGRYVVRYGPVQIVALGLEADAGALAFARTALAEPGPTLRFVLLHRPIQPDNPILPLLRERHVAAILSGHLHRYERRAVGGVRQWVVGTSGMGPGDEAHTRPSPDAAISITDYGALRVDADARTIRYTFVDEHGRVLDSTTEPTPSAAE
jgi:Calcineurin-like phosphoesterase